MTQFCFMTRNRNSFLIFYFLSTSWLLMTACSVSHQVREAATLAKCDFQISSVENINLAGINVQHIASVNDIDFLDLGKIMISLAGSVFPLTFQLNLLGRNPNDKPAGLNKLDWILFIDDIMMTSGSVEKAFIIPPDHGITLIPVEINVNLKQVLQGKSADALINFGLNLAGKGNTPTRFKIKIRPSIMIGNNALAYPGYITVKTDYSSE